MERTGLSKYGEVHRQRQRERDIELIIIIIIYQRAWRVVKNIISVSQSELLLSQKKQIDTARKYHRLVQKFVACLSNKIENEIVPNFERLIIFYK